MSGFATDTRPPVQALRDDVLLPRPYTYNTSTMASKKVRIFVNGDKFTPGKRFILNTSSFLSFDAFLDKVTASLKPSFGSVRKLYALDPANRKARKV